MSAALNFVGAFISISIAATIAKGIINPTVLAGGEGLVLVFAALIGAIVWNLITWYLAIPSSSSHALIGGVIGATIVASGAGAVKVHKLVQSVIVPAVLSPVICGAVAHGDISATHFYVPIWVKAACALAIALGTASGGWRTINTMGSRLTEVEAPQGFAAESSSAAVILVSSYYGYPLSTTQVVSGGVMGAGLGRRLASVHWNVAGQTVAAWLFTIPSAALLGAGAWEISDLFGSSAVGSVVTALLAVASAVVLVGLARRSKITPGELDRTSEAPETEVRRIGHSVPAHA